MRGTRLALAVTAALSTVANGGLMPQAKHGGSGKASVAIVGSKFEGTGLENEQMGQTQVPLTTGAGVDETDKGRGLAEREAGVEEDTTLWNCGDCDAPVLVIEPNPRLSGLGNKVTLADDLRNPALIAVDEYHAYRFKWSALPGPRVYQHPSDQAPMNLRGGLHRRRNMHDAKSDMHVLFDKSLSCIFFGYISYCATIHKI